MTYSCHCGKTFVRREHLTRHQATHRQLSHLCPTCGRSFSRNDLLQRHTRLHASDEGRRPRACDACHGDKRKCDGNGSACSLCEKRGIPCTYDRPSFASAPPASAGLYSSPGVGLSAAENSLEWLLEAVKSRKVTVISDLSGSHQNRIQSLTSECIDAYVYHIHHHWPFLHMPTLELETLPLSDAASLVVLGSWCQDRQVSHAARMELHSWLMTSKLESLASQVASGTLDPEKAWSPGEYGSALLSVLSEIHIHQCSTSRASSLVSLLVTVLRAIGMFSADASEYQEKTHFPGTFVPYTFTNRELWKRLAVTVFKAETLLSMLENRPPVLHIEELDVGLQSTFAMWNSDGLHIFSQRHEAEPCLRYMHKIHELAKTPPLNVPPVPLVEDIHLALCGLWARIWRYSRMQHHAQEVDEQDAEGRFLEERLAFWRVRLERLEERLVDIRGPSGQFLLGAYAGMEDETLSGKQDPALRRLKSLEAEARTLYHLLSIYLFTDLLALTPLKTGFPPEIAPSEGDIDHDPRLRGWTESRRGRAALFHASAALKAREESMTLEKAVVAGPLARAAVRAAVLVVWAWMNSKGACGPGSHAGSVVDLAHVVEGQEEDGGSWLEVGGSGTIMLDGVLLCSCAKEAWKRRFAALLASA